MYQGHCNDGSSVQKHSAGAHYPYVIDYTERGGYAVLTPSGIWLNRGTYAKADELATTLKTQDAKLH